jgi:hypothetical protein
MWFGLLVDLVEGIVARSEVLPLPSERRGAVGGIWFRDALITILDAPVVLGSPPVDLETGRHRGAGGRRVGGAGGRRDRQPGR